MKLEPEPTREKSELLQLKQRARWNNRAALVAGMLLVAYVCVLITMNYRSEMATRQTMLEYLKNETERSADNLSYFFSERQDDLANLALSREVAVFFENKALGMSMEYGLNLSLPPIKDRFLDLIQRKRISGEPVYARIALIDSRGTPLVDTLSPSYSPVNGKGWKRFLAPAPRNGAVMVVEGGKTLIVSMPYRFKGVHEGQILAWLSPGTIPRRLSPEISKTHRTCLVTRDGKDCLLTDTAHLPHDYLSIPVGTPWELTINGAGGAKERVIVFNVPVKNTPFLLFNTVPAADVLGRVAPWRFFVGMGVLAAAVLGGSFLVVRLTMKYHVLEARLDETMRRKREIREQNREMESFCYTVSHDLQAPLRGIQGYSDILREEYTERFDDTGRHYLERISSSTERMGQLIDGLLELSRVTRGELQRERVDLSGIVRGITEDLRHLEPARCVECVIAPGVQAEGDPTLLKAVLQNLLTNAWKFTGKKPCAAIEFSVADEDGERVYFVRDNGCGFNMEYVDKLFDPFRRLHRSDEYEGTGIGLATVQRIVHRHGGRVWAEAVQGEGATFYFTLA